ncbi:hypothetical protein BSKO_07506 [Bryopsis sp. KO-2023]|nr:hypothetical protein BSKO_07506 [Bryopsis sp. KO-2023]
MAQMSPYVWYPMQGYGYPCFYGNAAWARSPIDDSIDDSPASNVEFAPDVRDATSDSIETIGTGNDDGGDFGAEAPILLRLSRNERDWESMSDSAIYSASTHGCDEEYPHRRDDDEEYFDQLRSRCELLRLQQRGQHSSQDSFSWASQTFSTTSSTSSSSSSLGEKKETAVDSSTNGNDTVSIIEHGGEEEEGQTGERDGIMGGVELEGGWASSYYYYGGPEQYMNYPCAWGYHPGWASPEFWYQQYWMYQAHASWWSGMEPQVTG